MRLEDLDFQDVLVLRAIKGRLLHLKYLTAPRSLEELQTATPGPGYDKHHIVEQSQAESEGYSREAIDSPETWLSSLG